MKHIRGNQLEWDKIVPLATAAYNFFPCQSSRESPFVLMFGRDPITAFLSLLEPSPRCWGERGGHLHLDALQHLYTVTAENLRRARQKENTETETSLQNDLKIGDLVLVRDINSGVFEPKYSPNYRIIAIYGNNHIAVKALDSKVQVWRRGHIKKIDPVDKVILLLPSTEDYQKFGRKTKLLIHPDNIPDTNISLPSRKQTEVSTEDSEISENYQESCEKLEISSRENTKNDKLQPTTTDDDSEFGKNYQNSRKRSKTLNMGMLNSIDGPDEPLNEINISLISAPCPASVKVTVDRNAEVPQAEELV